MLVELRGYLRGRGPVTLAELTRQFKTDPTVMRQLLGRWQRKGKVQRCDAAPCQGGHCGGCRWSSLGGALESYRWLEGGTPPQEQPTTPAERP